MVQDPARMIDLAAAGFYSFVALYHLQVHFRRRSSLHLHVALAALAALGVDVTGMALLSVRPPWLAAANMLAVVLASTFLARFGAALSDGRLPIAAHAAAGIASAAAIAAAWRPALLPVVLLGSGGLLVYGAVRVLVDRSRRLPETGIVAAGFCGLIGTLVFDLLAILGVVPAVPGLPVIGFAALFACMGWALSDRFERAHRELDSLRIGLEARVAERTAAIEAANRRLRRYFPPQVVNRILSSDEDESPRTERRVVTILFADLVGFTAFADEFDPQVVCGILNEHFAAMIEEIESHQGTLDKIMGDGLMALFGAPVPLPPEEQAVAAVEAALAMQKRLAALRREWRSRRTGTDLEMRIGIHQEEVAIGSIGTGELRSYTAIGSGVNFAARLESAAPVGGVLVSDAVRRHLGGREGLVRVDALALKGITGSVDAFRVDPKVPGA